MPVPLETPSQIDGFESRQKIPFMRVLMEPPSISLEFVTISVFKTPLMLTMFLGFIHNGNSRHFCPVFVEFNLTTSSRDDFRICSWSRWERAAESLSLIPPVIVPGMGDSSPVYLSSLASLTDRLSKSCTLHPQKKQPVYPPKQSHSPTPPSPHLQSKTSLLSSNINTPN